MPLSRERSIVLGSESTRVHTSFLGCSHDSGWNWSLIKVGCYVFCVGGEVAHLVECLTGMALRQV